VASLTIRRLPDSVKTTLAARAARQGRSLEAEVRAILMTAATSLSADDHAEPFGQWAYRITRPGSDDLTGILDSEKAARKARGIPAPDFD
jgi:hypothetical protein